MHTLHGGPIDRVVERGKCGTFACCAYAKHHVFYVFIFWLYYFFYLELNTRSKFVPLMNLMQ